MIPTGNCPKCGAPYRPGTVVCEECGTALPPPQQLAAPTPAAAPQSAPQTMPMRMAAPAPAARNTGLLAAGVLLLVVALVGIGLVVMNGDDDGGSSSGNTSPSRSTLPVSSVDAAKLGAGEVLLEPVNQPTRDPFTADTRKFDEVPPVVVLPELPIPTTSSTLAPGQVVLPQVKGDTPGLYGGTRDQATCDKEKMITYLEQNPDKAAAWASVEGIPVSEIRPFIESLMPVELTHNMRVTNHGFRDGKPYAHQSLLQAGMKIYIDQYGNPRAKCSCGNPLLPPIPLDQPPTYVGDAWPSFESDPPPIVCVPADKPLTDVTLVDLETGGTFQRKMGTDGGDNGVVLTTGDVQVTVRWNDTADIDLAVKDPNGDAVNFDFPSVKSGGKLDVDANGNCENVTSTPVENIVWPDTAPPGHYVINIALVDDCGSSGPHTYDLTVLVDGAPVLVLSSNGVPTSQTGTISGRGTTLEFSFDRP